MPRLFRTMRRAAGRFAQRLLLCGLAVGLMGSRAAAQAPQASSASTAKASEERVEVKVVTGRVSGLARGFIAIEGDVDPVTHTVSEVAMVMDERLRELQPDVFAELIEGDAVAVQYREMTKMDPVRRTVSVSRSATRVVRLAPAAAEAPTTASAPMTEEP